MLLVILSAALAIGSAQRYEPDPYYPSDYTPQYENSYCDLNEDEYGRPYYSPYDNYLPPYHPTYPSYNRSSIEPTNYRSYRQAGPPFDTTYPQCVKSNCDQELEYESEQCYGSGVVYDRCNRRCSCVNGSVTDCCRVRKEWNCMSQEEKERYVNAVKEVSTSSTYKACYDALIAEHRALFTSGSSGIHGQQLFLPWHRWYILGLENLLRNIDCRITVPYWNWSLEPMMWQQSEVWDSDHGFGGNGAPCVADGPFGPGWTVTPSGGSGCLRRSFSGNVPDSAFVQFVQSHAVSSFSTWHNLLNGNLHGSVHCLIGGGMCTSDSANDPIFFLHHGFIDKLWADWQDKGGAYKNLPIYSANTNDMPGGHASSHTPSHYYDLDNQESCIKVCYQPECKPANLTDTLICPGQIQCNEYSPIKLARLVPRPLTPIYPQVYQLFGIPPQDQYVCDRFTSLMSDYDNIVYVLQQNGYEEGKRHCRTEPRNLNYDSYLYDLDGYQSYNSSYN